MQKVLNSNIIHVILILAVTILTGICDMHATAKQLTHDTALADSILHRHNGEMEHLSTRMVQSAYPVQIRIVGNAVCVKSNYNQVLPVYTESGSFYASFRLNKGTNWLSGLPRGTYYINNRKITIA